MKQLNVTAPLSLYHGSSRLDGLGNAHVFERFRWSLLSIRTSPQTAWSLCFVGNSSAVRSHAIVRQELNGSLDIRSVAGELYRSRGNTTRIAEGRIRNRAPGRLCPRSGRRQSGDS
ncbi:hypothetical protein M8818_004806 [Zalaria obscura]|uniref:Uncharacterized protein n=1 Tax=Zalaria obscura TaxID=2024903 RepID=A0ACC3SCD9_9PEZI